MIWVNYIGGKKIKTIILKIDDDVLGSLRSNINIKMMGGNFAGITDQFIKKLIDKIDDNNKEWYCEYKNKIKNNENKP